MRAPMTQTRDWQVETMTTEIIRYQIGEENAQAFEKAYQKAESILQASQHCLGHRMLRGQEEAQNWILMIEWDSVEGHEQTRARPRNVKGDCKSP
jgi:heme-degrading monooxygenase HmoA